MDTAKKFREFNFYNEDFPEKVKRLNNDIDEIEYDSEKITKSTKCV